MMWQFCCCDTFLQHQKRLSYQRIGVTYRRYTICDSFFFFLECPKCWAICRVALGWHLSALYYLWRLFFVTTILSAVAKRVHLLVRRIRALHATGVMSAMFLATTDSTTFFVLHQHNWPRVGVAFRRYRTRFFSGAKAWGPHPRFLFSGGKLLVVSVGYC